MSNKDPFLYSNQKTIWPERIEVGNKFLNRYNKLEIISEIKDFGNKRYIKTIEKVGEDNLDPEICRGYEQENKGVPKQSFHKIIDPLCDQKVLFIN